MKLESLHINTLVASHGRKRIIDELNLAPIKAGTITALVGPNGAGKSTLLRAIAGLVDVRGSIRLGDCELSVLTPAERAKHVTFMPQSLPQKVELTVLECVMVAFAASHSSRAKPDVDICAHAIAVLDRLGITDLAMEPVSRLSGGQRQMTALAQAVIRDPDIILLDEPTSALDLRHQETVMEAARMLAKQGKIVLVVLHDLAFAARWTDRVIVLADGGKVADGRPEEVITPDLLKQVYGVHAQISISSRGRVQIEVIGPIAAAPSVRGPL